MVLYSNNVTQHLFMTA